MINDYFLKRSIIHAIERARRAAQFENILAQDPDGKVIVNQGGLICYANVAAESFLGRSGKDLLGKPLTYPLPSERSVEVRTIKSGAEERLIEISAALVQWRKAPARLVTLREIKPTEHSRKNGRHHHEMTFSQET